MQVRFGAGHEERLGQMQGMEPGEIDIAPIYDAEAAGLESDLIEDVHIVEFVIRYLNESRDVAPQIEECMELYRTFVLAKTRPGKECETQVDRC